MNELVRLPTAFPKKPRPEPPKLEPIRYPHGPETAYAAKLLTYARRCTRTVEEVLAPRITKFVKRRTDEAGDQLEALIARLIAEEGLSRREARRWAIEMLDAVSVVHAAEFSTAYGQVLSINPYIGNEKWLPDRMAIATRENVELIQSIPEQLRRKVGELTSQAVLSGMRAEDLAVQIQEACGVTERRSLLIAQDQVGRWFGSLQRERQLDAQIEEYEWSTSSDERVRASHRARAGKTFRWDKPPAGGNHPGLEVRCVPGSSTVTALGNVLVACRRRHSGEATELVTAAGKTLCCTPNHPVLTARGWRAAQTVQEGDELIGTREYGLPFDRHEIDDVQPMVDEAFDALRIVGECRTIFGRAVDFHGDGSADEQIDVVTLDWSLLNDAQASGLQEACQLIFELADVRLPPSARAGNLLAIFERCGLPSNSIVRGFCKALALVGARAVHPDIHRAATAAWLDSPAHQFVAHRLAHHPRAYLNRLQALTGEVRGDEDIAIDWFRIMRHAVHGAPQVGLDAPSAEVLGQVIWTDAHRPSDRGDRPVLREQPRSLVQVDFRPVIRAQAALPQASTQVDGVNPERFTDGGYALRFRQHSRRIVEKRVRNLAGDHVYNFETPHGWYAANGHIVHNCRCVAVPVIPDWDELTRD